jgi:hypothetical protein
MERMKRHTQHDFVRASAHRTQDDDAIPWNTQPYEPPPKPKSPIERALERMDKIGDD